MNSHIYIYMFIQTLRAFRRAAKVDVIEELKFEGPVHKDGPGRQLGAKMDRKEVPKRAKRLQKWGSRANPSEQSGNAKNHEKPNKNHGFFKDLRGLDPLQNEARSDQNQSLEAKRCKVGAKLGPSTEKIRKKNEKSREPRGLGL